MSTSSNSERQQQGAKRAKLSKTSSALMNARAKESAVQRQHPGMMSANDRSIAHNGSVTALQTSDDGLHLFSAGRSCRAFFWQPHPASSTSGLGYHCLMCCVVVNSILFQNAGRTQACKFFVHFAKAKDSRLCSYETGTDVVRLWDIESGCNTLVNYEATRIRSHQGTQLAVSMDASLLFVASGHSIQVIKISPFCLRISLGLYIALIVHVTISYILILCGRLMIFGVVACTQN